MALSVIFFLYRDSKFITFGGSHALESFVYSLSLDYAGT